MALLVAGVSYLTAPIDVRERLAIGAHEVPEVARSLREATGAREIVLLSTCNRTEVYCVEADGREDSHAAPPGQGGDAATVEIIWRELSRRLGDDVRPYGFVRREIRTGGRARA